MLVVTSEFSVFVYLDLYGSDANNAELRQELKQEIRIFYHLSPQTKIWDTLMRENQCCGSYGARDFHGSAWWNLTVPDMRGYTAPPACCSTPKKPGVCRNWKDAWDVGCAEVLVDWLSTEIAIVNVPLIAVAVAQIVFGSMLASSKVRNKVLFGLHMHESQSQTIKAE